MNPPQPVADWMTDFDYHDRRWVEDPFALWRKMRETGEVARTDRYGGVYFPLSWNGIRAVASAPADFSSHYVVVREKQQLPPDFAPPITSDPPDHRSARACVAPAFANARVRELEGEARAGCRMLLEAFAIPSLVDAVAAYVHPAVAKVLGILFGLPAEDIIAFQAWHLERRLAFIRTIISDKRRSGQSDLVAQLVDATTADSPSGEARLLGHIYLLLVAGLETTAGVISSGLLHPADDARDQLRLRTHPGEIPLAAEEFLRAFAPVSTARVVKAGSHISGCPVEAGKMVLLSFAAANRDPSRFADPDRVLIDRGDNRHGAFGFGAHHCVGASLARMLITVALEEWLAAIPVFSRPARSSLEWLPGNVRALRSLPLSLGARHAVAVPSMQA